MANKINVSATLTFSKTGASAGEQAAGLFSMSGTSYQKGRQNVGFAAAEALNKGDAGSGGWCFIKNLDATNYVQVMRATGESAFMRIRAGEFAVFRFDTVASAPFVQANTAAVEIQYLWLSD